MDKEASATEADVAVNDANSQNSSQGMGLTSALSLQTRVRRIFNSMQLFLFALSFLSSWEAMISNLGTVFYNGGPRTLSWGVLVVLVGVLCQSASMAEMAAMRPIAGAQYMWTAALAPPRHRKVITWFQGWMTWFAWISTLIGVVNFTATVLSGIVRANYPEYEAQPWHLTLIIFAILIVQGSMAAWAFWLIPWIESLAGVLHVSLAIIFVVVLLVTTENKHSAHFVFFETSTTSGWTDSFISFNLGLLTPVWGFVGFDAAVHMAEEVRRARYAVPRAMFWSVAINGAIAYVIILTILFCMGSLEDSLNSSYPMLTILLNSTGSLKVATAMCCGLLLISLASNLGTMTSLSRLTWAWARDGGLPKYFSYISPSYRVPIRALWLSVFIAMLLALLNIGSTTAFGAFISLSTMGIFSSYIIAISCMLYARLSKEGVELSGWNLGRLGVPVNIFAIVYSAYIFVFLPFPSTLPVTGSNMNYALPIFAFAVSFVVFTWWTWARRKWPGLNEKVVEIVLADSDKNTKD